MLVLPVGEAETFIVERAAEGRIVAEMSVKTLRLKIQKYKAKWSSVNGGVESSMSVKQASVSTEKVEDPVQLEEVLSVETVENGSDNSSFISVAEDSLTVVESRFEYVSKFA